MTQKTCLLVGAPVDSGKRRRGCLMGPDAFRTAGLRESLEDLGHAVEDLGNLAPRAFSDEMTEGAPYALNETIAWTERLTTAAKEACARGFPIFLGGDHSLSAGTVAGVANHAAKEGRPLFVLWLDAHTDFHTPQSSDSGNLHGTPVAYFAGRDGFDGFPAVQNPVPEANICMIGLRSVDAAERETLQATEIRRHDMRDIDENGIARPLATFLEHVSKNNGLLHVSLDVDFLDPSVAPAVGTTVPGGATVREAHLVMEMLHDSGLLSSLDLVELNPFLDERGRTAKLMVDLAASALGRRVFDRPTRSFS
ncbi:arginase [Shimia sp. R9_1]|uniref:arginase n=1 Tax=unclassified Shimia TaxID=2630038 RepID=UPI001ADBF5AE|nr:MULTISPECIES: arginase [unclassified Shimia]MBO9400906.1 arginase [Shimia sp. R9_3]MBO9405823.1 arginase [Shimia sp. R9_1]